MRILSLRALGALLTLLPALAFGEKVALTFDDLPLNGALPAGVTEADVVRAVLPIFAARKAPPIYGFINARKLEGNAAGAQAFRLWVEGGQPLANHTYSHIDLSTNAVDAFMRDVALNEPVLMLLSRADEWRWFRYPYLHEGETLAKRDAVRAALAARGYRIAQVTLDYEDYMWNSAYARCTDKRDATSIAWLKRSYLETAAGYLRGNREMAKLVYGREIDHVLLLHLGAFSETILPSLFDLLKEQGFELATLDEVQRDALYAGDPQYAHARTGTLVEQYMDKRGLKYPPLPAKPRKELDEICR